MPVNHFYDETAHHRVVTAAMGEARPLWRSALLGAYIELVSIAQKALAEGVVSRADVVTVEPWATAELIEGLVRYGYATWIDDDLLQLVKHEKLAHWESADTVRWRRQQRKDVSDPVVTDLVRLRDGDQCRICHVVVKWGAPDSDPEGATFDHVVPRKAANGNPELLIVACRRCNGIRTDRPDANTVAPIQPPPRVPFYTKATAAYLLKRGNRNTRATGRAHLLPRLQIPVRPAIQADNANPEGKRTGKGPAHAPTEASEPTDSRSTRPETRPDSDPSSHQTREASSPPPPPPPRTKPPQKHDPPTGMVREGKAVAGSGEPPSPRSKRSRRSKPATPATHEESS